ncbi:4-carboxy-4-hydroxy-2-oxoadipate aldolase/oxaloacetate decarboxylase [Actinomadura sp. J1-007]|nr:4-carboxy-4-hydroxy-2-oxoadipate aldolase/oxaloacetate decarboxylase [Actinomadura sp. J1-007]
MTEAPGTTGASGLGKRLAALDACAVSDALDTLGLPGAVTGIGPLWPSTATVTGPVRTIRVAPKPRDGRPAQHIGTPVIESARPGEVVVIDNRGRTDVSCWGGILTVAALRKGIAGVIIDGACRDVAESHELGLPVHGRAVVPVSARGRIVQEAMDVPVTIGGAAVDAGDYAVADRSGVAFVPAARLAEVVELAERIAEREARMVEAVRAGRPVTEVMHDSKFPTAKGES